MGLKEPDKLAWTREKANIEGQDSGIAVPARACERGRPEGLLSEIFHCRERTFFSVHVFIHTTYINININTT